MVGVRLANLNNAVYRLGGMAQRANLLGTTPSSNKAISLDVRPLLPMILAGSALLYNQGYEATKPDGGEPNAWFRILMESGLAYLVLEHTSGVYPLFGIGLAAYRAGQQPTVLEQIKAVINTATTLCLGALGVTFAKGLSNMANQMDDQAIFNGLRAPHIQTWMDHLNHEAGRAHWNDETQAVFCNLHQQLQDLNTKLGQRYPDWLPEAERGVPIPANSEDYRKLADDILKWKTAAVKNFNWLGKYATDGIPDSDVQQAGKKLMSTIDYSQSAWTRFVRGMNPVCGYITMGLMIGAAILAPRINSWVSHRRSDLLQRQFQPALFPQDGRLLPPSSGHGSSNHSGRASHGSTYGVPYMVWEGMNNDQPTYSGDLGIHLKKPRNTDPEENEAPSYSLRAPYSPPVAYRSVPMQQGGPTAGYPQGAPAWYPQPQNPQQAH